MEILHLFKYFAFSSDNKFIFFCVFLKVQSEIKACEDFYEFVEVKSEVKAYKDKISSKIEFFTKHNPHLYQYHYQNDYLPKEIIGL